VTRASTGVRAGLPTTETDPLRRQSLSRAAFGLEGNIASNVYGTVVVMATVTAASGNSPDNWRLAAIVASSAVVFWLAHLYAHGLSESLELERRLTGSELTSIARRERGILLAAVAPTGAVLLGAAGIVRETGAVWLALSVGLVTLAVLGARYARVEGLALGGTLVMIALNLGLGLLVVALKAFVVH
jgi:hypothetical protein